VIQHVGVGVERDGHGAILTRIGSPRTSGREAP
jgi:hypothetical protein